MIAFLFALLAWFGLHLSPAPAVPAAPSHVVQETRAHVSRPHAAPVRPAPAPAPLVAPLPTPRGPGIPARPVVTPTCPAGSSPWPQSPTGCMVDQLPSETIGRAYG